MQSKDIPQSELKTRVARFAIDDLVDAGYIHSNMKIGLGTGSTAMPAVTRLAELIKEGKLKGIRAVATSFQTTIACEDLGIPVFSMNSREISGVLDLAIDGADEISPEKNLIKGGGAALLLEKIVAYNAFRFVIIADESKVVSGLGSGFALPVEIVAEARVSVITALEKLGAAAVLRQAVRKAGPVITDNGNLIVDCTWKTFIDPKEMENSVNAIVGVVENGFFTKNIPIVYIAHSDGQIEKK